MSADPPDESGDGRPASSDLMAVEGLSSDDERGAPSGAVSVVDVSRTAAPDDESGEHSGHYNVESLPRGTQLGRYVLLGRVRGRDEEVVYGAYDPDGDRKVGLKLFHPGGTPDDEDEAKALRLQLVRQAQGVANLSHPCVEEIYETGVYGPWVFLATEFIDGIDLRHWMEARDDPFPWPEVLRVFREAGRGLAAAHQQGVVHRDFKPSNVMMGKGGRLVVVDFGLAAAVAEQDDDIDIHQLRESLSGGDTSQDLDLPLMSGTPVYMAPEQHLTGRSDAHSDQFSFCVSLYEALYGERPFSGNRPRAIALEAAKHNIRPAPEGSTVPAWLRAIVVRGLSPNPTDRYPSMDALLRDLARDPAASRRRWWWGAALVGGLAGVGGVVAMQLEADRSACEDREDHGALSAVWNAEQREALHDAFTASGRRWAEPTWGYTETKLDAWASEWRDLSNQACLETRVWQDASEQHFQLRQACLERHLAGFESTLEVLGTVDGPMVDRAHQLVAELPGPRRCTDTQTLVVLGRPPDELRDEVETLHRELSGLEARRQLGRSSAVLDEVVAVLARAEDTGDQTLVARGLLLAGDSSRDVGAPKAEAKLHQAAKTALLAGNPGLAAQAWVARMRALLTRDPARAAEAVALGDYVEATAIHKRFNWVRATLDVVRSDAELARGRPAKALAGYHAAIEHEELRPDADRLRLVPAWLGQARVLMDRGELDNALPPLTTALGVVRDSLGPHHPAAVDILHRLGRVQMLRGAPVEARAHYEQALELVRESAPDDETLRTDLEAKIGALWAADGDPARARTHLEYAYQASTAGTVPGRDVFQLGLALAKTRIETDDGDNAMELLDTLLAPYVAKPVPRLEAADDTLPTLSALMEAETVRAALAWDSGDQARAIELVESVLDRLGGTPEHEAYREDFAIRLEEYRQP